MALEEGKSWFGEMISFIGNINTRPCGKIFLY